MATPQTLDLSLYVTAPRLSVPTAVALGIALLSATPKPAPAVVRRAATRMRNAVLELQHGWRSQVAANETGLPTPREADTRVDRAMRATSMRLEALTLLPAEASPDVAIAQQVYPRLFPEGLRFLTLPYTQQWAYCDRLLSTLDDEAHAADVERLVGETVLEELRAAQAAYGEALGITTAKETLAVVSLAGPLEAVRSAIVAYALQIVAMQSDDPSRLPAARKALAPIDALRAAQAAPGRRTEGSAEGPIAPVDGLVEGGTTVTPDTPVPAVEEDAATGS